MEPSSTPWELDSDDIASIASEDLHSNRPNRWTGPKSSWRTLTEDERLLWHSMKQLQDQNLAVHLYNAFALKRRAKDPALPKDFLVKDEEGRDASWAPHKRWTAWPLKERQVPKDRLYTAQHRACRRALRDYLENSDGSVPKKEEQDGTTNDRRFRR
ncbi:hypothetical protein G7046_g4785 [Stylonectria norvegica]|nr:hypothetical protein G7046_g4785 [Stylonectria norvegica]